MRGAVIYGADETHTRTKPYTGRTEPPSRENVLAWETARTGGPPRKTLAVGVPAQEDRTLKRGIRPDHPRITPGASP